MRTGGIVLLLLWTSVSAAADDSPVDLAKIDRKIVREPKYQNQPHYAMFVFGQQADRRAWFVVDGDNIAYIDRNGNGDLTEPNERVPLDAAATAKINLGGPGAYKAMNVFPLGEVFGARLTFQLWVRNPDFDASRDDFYRNYFREWDEKHWINGSLMRMAEDKTESQNPLLLTIRPADAQITHFDGPLTFALKWEDRQRLEPWPKKTVFDVHIVCRNLLAKDCDHQGFGFTRLTTTEIPRNIHPVAVLEFPAPSNGGQPITQKLKLDERCCGDTFYASLTLPREIASGAVNVRVEFPEWIGPPINPAVFQVPVNQQRSKHHEQMLVMFRDPKVELKHAVNVLRKQGMELTIREDILMVPLHGTPAIAVRIVRSEEVLETAKALGLQTEHAEALSRCDARFEITFVDLDEVLKEQATLKKVQSALQNLTQGYVYTTWDRRFASPR